MENVTIISNNILNASSNKSLNESTEASKGRGSSEYTFYISLTLIWIPGFLTNVLALVFIIRDIKKAVFPAIVLLLVLCSSDLLAVCFSFTRHILSRYTNNNDFVTCVSVSIIHSFFKIYSGVVNAMMSADRVLAICKPFYYKSSVDVATWKLGCILSALAVACLNCFPLIGLGNYMSHSHGIVYCNVLGYKSDPFERVYGAMYAIICNLCVLTIVVGNGVLIKAILKMNRRIVNISSSSESTTTESDPSSSKAPVTSFEIAFAKLMGCLALVYLVCGTPFNVLTLLDQFNVRYSPKAIGYIHLLAGFRYTVDPCVYILIRKTNRKRISEFFCRCKRDILKKI